MTTGLTAICGTLGRVAANDGTCEAMLSAMAAYGSQTHVRATGSARLGAVSATSIASALAVDSTAGLACVADARLDDRGALCDALSVPRALRASLPDSKLILRAYERWREAVPAHLLGDYAFAVWDKNQRTLFCARDHVGARPLYYAELGRAENGLFVFASTVAAVLAAPSVSPAFDEAVVAAQLGSDRTDRRARTCYRAVRRVPAGHSLVVALATSRGDARQGIRMHMVRHWRPENIDAAPPASDDAYAEQFLDLFEKAVQARLPGGPVGVHLSGGLDSSGIAVHASRTLRAQGLPPPPAFSWQPTCPQPKPAAAEYRRIDAVCRQEGLQVFHCGLVPEDVVQVLRLDGTLPGAEVAFEERAVMRRARALGVRVLLSGYGGDECASFNGRGHWQSLLLRCRWRALAAAWRAEDRAVWRLLARTTLPLLHPYLPLLVNHMRHGRGVGERWFIAPAFVKRTKPLTKPLMREVGARRAQLRFVQDGRFEFQEQLRAFGVHAGIEYRFPLLDRRLLEFALSLPPEQFRRPGASRWIMRHALRHSLPPEVCWNRIKAEPARIYPLIRTVAEALPAIRQRIERCPPSRASYVDIPALLAQMRQDPLGTASHFMPARAALAFLDF